MRSSMSKYARCSNQDNYMRYFELHDEWYCVECQKNNRIWYPAHGSEEDRWQHDYINYYYELKEKFTNKYLNKEKKITED